MLAASTPPEMVCFWVYSVTYWVNNELVILNTEEQERRPGGLILKEGDLGAP